MLTQRPDLELFVQYKIDIPSIRDYLRHALSSLPGFARSYRLTVNRLTAILNLYVMTFSSIGLFPDDSFIGLHSKTDTISFIGEVVLLTRKANA
jgi:hypothetical protein